MKNSIPYDVTLKRIKEKLDLVEQWLKHESHERVLKYHNHAEALIELLEVYNCGQIGGYDYTDTINQQGDPKYFSSLKGRYEWLKLRKQFKEKSK